MYEFAYPPVLDALAAAATRGVDVKIIYDRRGRASTDPSRTKVWEVSEPAIAAAGLTPHMIPRRTNSAISHNKFLILLKNDTAQSVWTGSTNLTWGGLFGQSNVGHLLREPAIADTYLQLWNRLATDPGYADIRPANTSHTATPASPPATGISPIFSPRTSLDMIDWYAHQAGNADKSFFMTAAFGLHEKIANAIAPESNVLRYLVLEKPADTDVAFDTDRDVKMAIGSFLRTGVLDRWTQEQLTGLNRNVLYSHTKYMLIDPLDDNPLVISGSGNFSDPSVTDNDENMLIIQGDTRVADIYLGEFMRVFNHFYFRYLRQQHTATSGQVSYLQADDTWTERYYDRRTPSYRQRLLFR